MCNCRSGMSCGCLGTLQGMGGLRGLSDVHIATTADCAAGRVSVSRMRATFDNLSINPTFRKDQFLPAVAAIETEYAANSSFYDEWIPFNLNCGAIRDIGQQADTLASQMLASVGASDFGSTPSSPPAGDLNSLIMLGMLVAGVMLLSNVKGLLKS